jgi:hypothetical protein
VKGQERGRLAISQFFFKVKMRNKVASIVLPSPF